MLFNSWQFAVFLPLVTALFFILPYRARIYFMLAASWYFYASWNLYYLPLIVLSTGIDFLAAKQISKSRKPKNRKFWLVLSLVLNLGLLFVFKYLHFFTQSFSGYSFEALLLPIGISFYTFQSISYTIDVYRDKLKPEPHFAVFALYVSFFPQLVAGPIERAGRLMPQFKKKAIFSIPNLVSGLRLMLWGYFQKVVVADNLAAVPDLVFAYPNHYTGTSVMLASLFFGAQILADFSGYTNIARGAARVVGVELIRNFNNPYFSQNLKQFWNRWHISLSEWFRDYVYISLGGNRVGRLRHKLNLLLTFTLSGLWHGAGWNYLVWGALHGGAYILPSIAKKSNTLLIRVIRIFITFAFVHILWVFFRAQSVSDALILLKNAFDLSAGILPNFDKYMLVFNGVFIAIFYFVQYKTTNNDFSEVIQHMPEYGRFVVYLIFLFFILFFGNFGLKEFIYFRF